jgi:hypothetical protein
MEYLEKTINAIDELKKLGVIDSYSICGGIASLFYIEPVSTSAHVVLRDFLFGKYLG